MPEQLRLPGSLCVRCMASSDELAMPLLIVVADERCAACRQRTLERA